MSVHVYGVVIFMLAAIAAAVPISVAHYARAPDNRLGVGPLVFVGIGTLGVLGIIYKPPVRVSPLSDAAVWAMVGMFVGIWAFIAYGVVERLVLPFVMRVRMWVIAWYS